MRTTLARMLGSVAYRSQNVQVNRKPLVAEAFHSFSFFYSTGVSFDANSIRR